MPDKKRISAPAQQQLFLVLFLLCLGAGLAANVYLDYRQTYAGEQERLQTQAKVVQENLIWNLDALNKALVRLANDKHILLFNPSYNQRLADLNDAMPGIRTIFVMDQTGTIRISNRPELIGRDLHERDYFNTPKQQASQDMLFVSPPFKTVLGTYVINISRIIYNANGEFAGIVTAALDPEYFKTLMGSVRYTEDMWTAIMHGNGQIFLIMPDRKDVTGKNIFTPDTFFARHLASSADSNTFSGLVKITEEQRMITFRTIQPESLKMDKPLVVATSRDLASIYRAWHNDALLHGALYLLFAVLSSLLLLLYQRYQTRVERQKAEAEQSLKELSDELDRFFSMALDMLCIADSEGRFRRLNRSWEEVLGYSLDELIGQQFLDFVHPDDISATLAAMADLDADKPIFNFINRYRCKDGSYRWIEWRSTPYLNMVYAAARDITERKNAEAALRAALTQAERFREALDHVSSYIYMKDRDHRYVYANKPTLELFGVTADELIGCEDCRFFPPATVTRLREVDTRVFSGEQSSVEIDVADATGRSRVYWEVKTPIYENMDRTAIWGLCGISTDISELKQAQLQLELLNKELQTRTAEAESANLAKSEFLANMSHEIRTPMNAILGLTRIVLDTELTSRQADYLRKVYGSSQALMVVLNDILDYSKIEAGRLEIESLPICMADILQDTQELFSARLEEKGLAMQVEIDPHLPELVMGDPLRVSQILNNLVGNAIKFTETGEICLKTELASDNGETLLLRFAVRDTGIGLSKEQSDRLFQAFTQADGTISRKYGGTGLGLSISQRLVKLMGGDINVSSVEGAGATFSFVIQVAKAPPGTQVARNHRPKPVQKAGSEPSQTTQKTENRLLGARILLVEDNRINQEVAAEFLCKQGAVVTLADHGAEALEMIKRPAFDLVLMDLHMPVMDGFEATCKIREFYGNADLPIIAMTAAVMQDDRDRCAVAGMVDFVAKPINPEELTMVLQKWLKQPENASVVPLETAMQPPLLSLTSMPGFDSASALRRMNGNARLLCSLLLEFADDHAADGDELSTLLATGNLDGACHLLHSIKGVAGTIGAVALAEAAAALEQELRANTVPSDTKPFNQALATAISVIQATLTAGPDIISSNSGETPNISLKELQPLLTELTQYLREQELVPDALLQKLSAFSETASTPEPAATIKTLLRQLDRFDHAGALDTVERMLATPPLA